MTTSPIVNPMFWLGCDPAVGDDRANCARELGTGISGRRRATAPATTRKRAAWHDRIRAVCRVRILPSKPALRRPGFHTRRQALFLILITSCTQYFFNLFAPFNLLSSIILFKKFVGLFAINCLLVLWYEFGIVIPLCHANIKKCHTKCHVAILKKTKKTTVKQFKKVHQKCKVENCNQTIKLWSKYFFSAWKRG